MSRICHDANFREYIAAIQDTENERKFLMQALPERTL
jgi:hypothetical protein